MDYPVKKAKLEEVEEPKWFLKWWQEFHIVINSIYDILLPILF